MVWVREDRKSTQRRLEQLRLVRLEIGESIKLNGKNFRMRSIQSKEPKAVLKFQWGLSDLISHQAFTTDGAISALTLKF